LISLSENPSKFASPSPTRMGATARNRAFSGPLAPGPRAASPIRLGDYQCFQTMHAQRLYSARKPLQARSRSKPCARVDGQLFTSRPGADVVFVAENKRSLSKTDRKCPSEHRCLRPFRYRGPYFFFPRGLSWRLAHDGAEQINSYASD
jgi:hypothetical protein